MEPFRNVKREWMNDQDPLPDATPLSRGTSNNSASNASNGSVSANGNSNNGSISVAEGSTAPAKKAAQRPRKLKSKLAAARDARYVRVDSMMRKIQLDEALGDKVDEYWDMVLKYLRAKLSKRELDAFVLRVLGTNNVWLHNEFFFAVLHNANCSELPPKSRKPAAPKKPEETSKRKKPETRGIKMEPKQHEQGDAEPKDSGLKRFRHVPMQYWKNSAQFLRSLKKLGIPSSRIAEQGHFAREDCLSSATFPYISTTLPDKSDVHARLLVAAREQGMGAVAEDAAELVQSACELYLRELLTSVVSFVQPHRPPPAPAFTETKSESFFESDEPEIRPPLSMGIFSAAYNSPPASPVEQPLDSPELVSCPLFSLHPLCSSTPSKPPPLESSMYSMPQQEPFPEPCAVTTISTSSTSEPSATTLLYNNKPATASPLSSISSPQDAALMSLLSSASTASSPSSLLFLLSSAASTMPSSWNINPASGLPLPSFPSALLSSPTSSLSLLSLLSAASLPPATSSDPTFGMKDPWSLPLVDDSQHGLSLDMLSSSPSSCNFPTTSSLPLSSPNVQSLLSFSSFSTSFSSSSITTKSKSKANRARSWTPKQRSSSSWENLLDTSYTELRDIQGDTNGKYNITMQDLLGALQVNPEFVKEMPTAMDKLLMSQT